MRAFSQWLINYAVFAVMAILACALQSSLWLHLFGWFPAPQIWLTIFVFWVLYRELWESVLMMYLLAVIASGFTALSFAHLLAINLLTMLSLVFAKQRVYWSGSVFFMLACGTCVLFFTFFSFLISWRYDVSSNQDLPILALILTIFLTMFVSLPLHRLFSWLDQLTHKEHPTEAGTGVL